MTPLFWIAIAVDAVLLMILLVLSLSGDAPPDGGRGMATFFSIVVPTVIVGIGALLFLKSRSPVLRTIALILVAGPGLLVAATRLRSAAIDYQVRRNAEGSGYFPSPELQRAGSAVVRRDAAGLLAIGKSVDVNAKGKDGMTLMELAVSGESLDVVRALLSLGADPNTGLVHATKLEDMAILSALIDAGAKPGYADDQGPVVFHWLNMMPLANAVALLDRGLDVNITDGSGVPLIVAAAQNDRWDFVLILMDRGADPARADRHGTRLADVVQSRIESTSTRPPEMRLDIAKVKALLGR